MSMALATVTQVAVLVASADGVGVLREVFRSLHGNFPGALVILLHAGNGRERGVADNLNVDSSVMVSPATDGATLRNGHAYVVPAGAAFAFGEEGRLVQGTGGGLLSSLAARYGPGALAVALTGLDAADLAGFQEVRAAGGRTLALDEADRLWADSSGPRVVPDVADEHLAIAVLGPRMIAMLAPQPA